jgi:alcohol dehydrogenase
VIRYNAAAGPEVAGRYADVARLLGVGENGSEPGHALADHVAALGERLGLPARLSGVGVPGDGIALLVEGAMGDVCTLVNPREPTQADFEALFRAAL